MSEVQQASKGLQALFSRPRKFYVSCTVDTDGDEAHVAFYFVIIVGEDREWYSGHDFLHYGNGLHSRMP